MLFRRYLYATGALFLLLVTPARPVAGLETAPAQLTRLAPAVELQLERPGVLLALRRHMEVQWRVPETTARRILEAAQAEAAAHNLPLSLLLAVMAKESSFRPDAKSAYGALGLMQVVPRWHPDKLEGISHRELFNPAVNVRVGARVLNEYLAQANGDLRAALLKYSGALPSYPGRVLRYKEMFERVIQRPEAYI